MDLGSKHIDSRVWVYRKWFLMGLEGMGLEKMDLRERVWKGKVSRSGLNGENGFGDGY